MLQIGRYRLIEKLSDGFPGALWSARPRDAVETADTLVSLRTINISNIPELIDELWQAARWATELEVNGEQAMLDVVVGSGTVSCIAPLHPGETLATLRERLFERRTPAPTSVVLRIVLDMVAELQVVAHAATTDARAATFAFGGIHSDGILLGFDGRSRLLDVGVGAVASQHRQLTRWDRRRLAYEAPERCGQDGAVDERSDTFTIGILLWELLTGRELFRGEHPEDVAAAVTSHTIEPLDSTYTRRKKPFEPGVAALVDRALKRDPKERFQTLQSLREAIEALDTSPSGREDVAAFVKQSAGLGSRVMQEHLAALEPAVRSGFPTPPPSPESLPAEALESIPPTPPIPRESVDLLGAAAVPKPPPTPRIAEPGRAIGGKYLVVGLLLIATLIGAVMFLRATTEPPAAELPAASVDVPAVVEPPPSRPVEPAPVPAPSVAQQAEPDGAQQPEPGDEAEHPTEPEPTKTTPGKPHATKKRDGDKEFVPSDPF